jgi:hypothetical protein
MSKLKCLLLASSATLSIQRVHTALVSTVHCFTKNRFSFCTRLLMVMLRKVKQFAAPLPGPATGYSSQVYNEKSDLSLEAQEISPENSSFYAFQEVQRLKV